MDAITAFALSVDNPALKTIGWILDNELAYAAIILALVLIGEQRNNKRVKIIVAIFAAIALATVAKYALLHPRPCFGEAWCPTDYSFPSTHAAVAFTLTTAFLNKRSYIAYLFFALFVAFTRMNLGVHSFEDIAAALPVALIAYYSVDTLWKWQLEAKEKGNARWGKQ